MKELKKPAPKKAKAEKPAPLPYRVPDPKSYSEPKPKPSQAVESPEAHLRRVEKLLETLEPVPTTTGSLDVGEPLLLHVTMTKDTLTFLAEKGARIRRHGESLLVSVPINKDTDRLIAVLRERKADLLALLDPEAHATGRAEFRL